MTMKLGFTKGRVLLAAAATAFLAYGPAQAADVMGEATPDKHQWDIAFGVTFTSDYVSRGATNTDGNAAVQPFAEFTLNDFFYVGYWGSNVSYSGVTDWENDLSIGIRPTLGPVDFDFGYVRYVYSSGTVADYGEVYGKASFSPVDPFTVGAAVYWNPDNSDHYLEANASVDLPYNFSASAAIGSNSVGGATTTPWNIGVGWAPQDWVSFDARYHSGAGYDKFVVGMTLSSSLKTLGVIH